MPVQLQFRLSELPSAQHQAGLGGFLVLLSHLEIPHQVDEESVSLTLDQESLSRIFALLYEGIDAKRMRKDKPTSGDFTEVPVVLADGTPWTRYEIKERRPAGKWMSAQACDEALEQWQDGVWFTLRDRAATRKVYQEAPLELVANLWKVLGKQAQGQAAAVPISSAICVGVRAKNPEGIEFEAHPHHALLLHCAHAVAVPYSCVDEDREGQREFAGTAWVYPVPSPLDQFPSAMQRVWASRQQRPQMISEGEAGLHLLSYAADGIVGAYCARLQAQGNDTHLRAVVTLRRQVAKTLPTFPSLTLRAMVTSNHLQGRSLFSRAHALVLKLGPERCLAGGEEGEAFSVSAARLLESLGLEPWHRTLLDLLQAALEEGTMKRYHALRLPAYRAHAGTPKQRAKLADAWLSAAWEVSRQLRRATSAGDFQRCFFHLVAASEKQPMASHLGSATRLWQEAVDLLAVGLSASSSLQR